LFNDEDEDEIYKPCVNFDVDHLTNLRILHVFAWIGSYRLLIYEYRKGLSEAWYSHKFFWIMNFFAFTVSFAYGAWYRYQNYFHLGYNISIMICNSVLLGLLMNTK